MNLARLGKLEITEEKLFYLEEKHFHFQFLDKPFYNRLPLYYQGRVYKSNPVSYIFSWAIHYFIENIQIISLK